MEPLDTKQDFHTLTGYNSLFRSYPVFYNINTSHSLHDYFLPKGSDDISFYYKALNFTHSKALLSNKYQTLQIY